MLNFLHFWGYLLHIWEHFWGNFEKFMYEDAKKRCFEPLFCCFSEKYADKRKDEGNAKGIMQKLDKSELRIEN